MKYFPPYLYCAINIDDGLKNEDLNFSSYLNDIFDNIWQKNIKDYETWIQSSQWNKLIAKFYHKFQLHDKQIRSLQKNYLVLDTNVIVTIDYESLSIKNDIFPKWMSNDKEFGEFLYDEFTEENGRLNWEFYDSNGNLFHFVGVSNIS